MTSIKTVVADGRLSRCVDSKLAIVPDSGETIGSFDIGLAGGDSRLKGL